MTPHMWFATATVGVLCIGLYFKKRPAIHGKIMTLGILMDLGLVLKLQIQRDAVGTAITHSYGLPQYIHFATSGTAALLYIPVLILGAKCLARQGQPHANLRQWHIRVASTAILFRFVGFLFMFSMIGNLQGGS